MADSRRIWALPDLDVDFTKLGEQDQGRVTLAESDPDRAAVTAEADGAQAVARERTAYPRFRRMVSARELHESPH
jgi:hypothetical protein